MTGRLILRFLAEYARRPINLVLLIVVPVIFVAVVAGALADFSELLGGVGGPTLETAAAGCAAAFLAGVAGFFHVIGSHAADRRLAAVGAGTPRVVGARLASAGLLALLAAAGALTALWVRTGVEDLPRTVGTAVMFAVIYSPARPRRRRR